MIVTQLCLTLYDPTDCNPPGSSVHGIVQARILERVAISSSRCCINSSDDKTYHLISKNYSYKLIVFSINFFNWMLITLQYCGDFCHTSTWISHWCTRVPHPEPPLPTSLPTLSLWVFPEHQLWVPCFMHQTCTGHLFYILWYTCFDD